MFQGDTGAHKKDGAAELFDAAVSSPLILTLTLLLLLLLLFVCTICRVTLTRTRRMVLASCLMAGRSS
jgi:hypothetical protein